MNFSTQLNLLTPNNSAKKVNEPVKNKNYRQYQNAPEKDSLKISSQENCPRKIRDKEQSDVNEFLECHIEKVSSDGSKARGGNCDTRLEKQKEKTGLVKKWGKIAATVGGGIALLTGTLIAKKKLDIKNAKRLQEEARKKSVEIAQKARAEQLKKEEEARIAAQKAFEEKAQRRLEEKAKLKAEQEAKLKAQKEAEAQKAAQLAEHNAYLEKLENIIATFFKKFSNGGTMHIDGDFCKFYTRYTAEEFLQNVIETVKNAEKQGIDESDIKKIFSVIKESIKSTKFEYQNEFDQTAYDFNLSKVAQKRKDIINDIETLEQSVERKDGETFGDYLARLADIRKSKMTKATPVERVRAKLKYDDTIQEPEGLTDEEMKRLIQWKPEVFKDLSKEEALNKLKQYADGWTMAHTSDESNTSAYQLIEDILLKKAFNRYDSSTYRFKSNDYEVEPLYRWMSIYKGYYKLKPDGSVDYNSTIKSVDAFVDEYFKVGGEYIAPRMQSCSKNKGCAETYFHDNNQYMTVKLVIHPKGKVSKAADLGWGRYGENEAVYPAGTRFKVIDRHLEECVNPYYKEDSPYSYDRVFFRWIIDLQEM